MVDSVWTDLDADGKPQSEPTLWALRLTDGKWRISGMAAEIGTPPPMVIDFENPETMAPPKPIDPATVVGPATTAARGQPGERGRSESVRAAGAAIIVLRRNAQMRRPLSHLSDVYLTT